MESYEKSTKRFISVTVIFDSRIEIIQQLVHLKKYRYGEYQTKHNVLKTHGVRSID